MQRSTCRLLHPLAWGYWHLCRSGIQLLGLLYGVQGNVGGSFLAAASCNALNPTPSTHSHPEANTHTRSLQGQTDSCCFKTKLPAV